MSLTKDQIDQVLEKYSASDDDGGRKIKVDVIASVADDVDATIVGPLGQAAAAASIPVVIASNQTAIPVTTVIPGTAATNLGKAEDAVHATGDTGVMALAVANEAQATLAADGDYTPIAVDTKGSVLVKGNVGGFTTLVSSTVVMSVAGAYATGDYMGTTTSPQSFTSAVRTSGGTGIIKSILISDKIVTANVAMELWIINQTFTAPTDNAAWDLSDANMLFVQGVIPIAASSSPTSGPGWFQSSAGQVYFDNTLSIPIKPSTGTAIFYALVARGTTPAFTSADLTVTLGILQD